MKYQKIMGIILMILGGLFGIVRPFTSCKIYQETYPITTGYLASCVTNSIIIGVVIILIGILLILKKKK